MNGGGCSLGRRDCIRPTDACGLVPRCSARRITPRINSPGTFPGPLSLVTVSFVTVGFSSVADLNRLVGHPTVLRPNRLFDEVARAGRRIDAQALLGLIGGRWKGRRHRNHHGRSRSSKKQILHDTVPFVLSRIRGRTIRRPMSAGCIYGPRVISASLPAHEELFIFLRFSVGEINRA